MWKLSFVILLFVRTVWQLGVSTENSFSKSLLPLVRREGV